MKTQNIYISPAAIANMLIEGEETYFKVIANGLPKDAKVVCAGYDKHKMLFYMHIESESFRDMIKGEHILNREYVVLKKYET